MKQRYLIAQPHVSHSYHLVEQSLWPFTGSLGALRLTGGLLEYLNFNEAGIILTGLTLIRLTIIQWWRDVANEGTYLGWHVSVVELGLRWGMGLFIISEVFFFVSFFWAFFHRRLAPAVELGSFWPPVGINPLNPWEVPLLNRLVLIRSGVRVTWSHFALLSNYLSSAIISLRVTVLLGSYFSFLQYEEYLETSFSFSDRIFGRSFFIATGFHGIHVFIGRIFLLVSLVRITQGALRKNHHFGFEAASWYWHFVDVIWLFLFVVIYWWGAW